MRQDRVPRAIVQDDNPIAAESILAHWHCPTESEAATLVSVSVQGHLESQGASQKSIPRAMLHETLQTLHWLSRIVDMPDNAIPKAIRLSAYLLLIRAPTALWPMPTDHDLDARGKCKSYSRVRAVRTNLDLIHSGRWLEVLVPDSMPADTAPRSRPVRSDSTQPGEMDKHLAQQLLRTCQNGRVGKAWKQLWSPGLAPGSQTTVDAMRPQLGNRVPPHTPGLTTALRVHSSGNSASSTAASYKGAFVSPPTIAEHWKTSGEPSCLPGHASTLPFDCVDQVRKCINQCPTSYILGRFRDGTAGDVLGWHSESLRQVYSYSHSRRAIMCIVEGLILGSMPAHMAQLATMSRVVPLRKSFQGTRIRPISIPTVYRKVTAHICLHVQMPEVTARVAKEQFGLKRKDGCEEMRNAVLEISTTRPEWNLFKTDIANAFNAAGRAQLLEGMQTFHPLHAAMSQHWLRVPSLSAVRLESREYAVLSTTHGVPQGDPMSVMAFCISMQLVSDAFWRILEEHVMAPHEICQIFGYIDDYVLAVAPGSEHLVLTAWHDALAQHGFSLNAQKTQVWSPCGVGPRDVELRAIWCRQSRNDGLTLCGAPVAFAPDTVQDDLQALEQFQRTHATRP
eukprot:4443567-Amphidinium_carterae.2